MALVKVTTPVPDYSGSVGGVHFAGGVGYADPDKHAAELDYFRARGYHVDEPGTEALEEEPEAVVEEPVDEAPAKPAGNASTETWRSWAVDHGGMSAEEAGALSRDQLVERFAETETES